MQVYQWAIVFLLVTNFLAMIHRDIEGRPAKEPQGFSGVMASFVAFAILVGLFWGAGLFSALWGN